MQLVKKYFLVRLLLTAGLVVGQLHIAVAQDVMISGRVKGKGVVSGTDEPLAFAVVRELNGTAVAIVDVRGDFSIRLTGPLPQSIVISCVGYETDTVLVPDDRSLEIRLSPMKELKEVEVTGRRSAVEYSMIKPINVEQMGKKEILKAACCNLSEAFESSPTVNVAYTDAVTGAKEIRLLGLSGIYSQLLTEAIPNFRGIAGSYGLYFIPGPWMEAVQVTKGTGSVQQGYEAFAGQINVEYLKPDEEKTPRYFLNLFGEQNGNMEINLHARQKLNDRWSTILMAHGNYMDGMQDLQHDGFLDIPHARQVNLYNRWQFHSGKRLESQLGWRYIQDKREGGQTGLTLAPGFTPYTTAVMNRRLEVFGKLGIVFPEKPSRSIGNIVQLTAHQLDSRFGVRTYDAVQRTLLVQSIYQNTFPAANHQYKVGVNYRLDHWTERVDSSDRVFEESVPGMFAEYTYNHNDRFTLVAGGRLDHHNLYGWFPTLRLHARYNFTPDFLIRCSAGSAFRVPNLYSDNISVFASSRRIILKEEIRPEKAWNFGFNTTFRFTALEREGTVNLDVYRTEFQNQLVVDRVTSASEVSFYNLHGVSYANSAQLSIDHELLNRLEVRLAFKMDDVRITYSDSLQRKPLVPRSRGLINLAYKTGNEHWRFDYTIVREGSKRLLTTFDEPAIATSPVFITMNLQITKTFRSFEVYGGAENLLNYFQEQPIVSAADPFSPRFEAADIWGPVDGRRIYVGFRMSIR